MTYVLRYSIKMLYCTTVRPHKLSTVADAGAIIADGDGFRRLYYPPVQNLIGLELVSGYIILLLYPSRIWPVFLARFPKRISPNRFKRDCRIRYIVCSKGLYSRNVIVLYLKMIFCDTVTSYDRFNVQRLII